MFGSTNKKGEEERRWTGNRWSFSHASVRGEGSARVVCLRNIKFARKIAPSRRRRRRSFRVFAPVACEPTKSFARFPRTAAFFYIRMLISRVTLVTWGNLVHAQVNIRVIASGQRRIHTFRVTRQTSNPIYVYALPPVSQKNARLIWMRLIDTSTLMWTTEITTRVDVKVFKEIRSRATLRYFRKSVNNY